MGNTHAVTGAHFARSPSDAPGRRRQAGFVSIALGVGLIAFAFLDSDGTPVRTTSPTVPPASEPTVLGVTVEPEPTTPEADPADPVVGELVTGSSSTAPTRPRPTSTTRTPATTTTTEAPVLIPPTVVTNTTTTTEATTTTTGETTTTTGDVPPE